MVAYWEQSSWFSWNWGCSWHLQYNQYSEVIFKKLRKSNDWYKQAFYSSGTTRSEKYWYHVTKRSWSYYVLILHKKHRKSRTLSRIWKKNRIIHRQPREWKWAEYGPFWFPFPFKSDIFYDVPNKHKWKNMEKHYWCNFRSRWYSPNELLQTI